MGYRDLPMPVASKIDCEQWTPDLVPTQQHVAIVPDLFTSRYNPDVLAATVAVLKKLGKQPVLLPLVETGKAWHIKGFLKTFARIATKNVRRLNAVAKTGIPLVSIDPSIASMYHEEYAIYSEQAIGYTIQPIQQFLASCKLPDLKTVSATLLCHCMDQPGWESVFANSQVTIKPVSCCGMAGIYGHDVRQYETSKKIYEMSWKPTIADNQTVLTTGFSCQSQVQRFDHKTLLHPVQLLASILD